MGCPDVSLLTALSQALGADLTALLSGRLPPEEPSGGTMKRAKYYVCPVCGGITMTTGQGTLSCCGRTLEALTPRKAAEGEKLSVERVEDEWYVTSSHPMTKDHHIALLAFAAPGPDHPPVPGVGPVCPHPRPGTRHPAVVLHPARPVLPVLVGRRKTTRTNPKQNAVLRQKFFLILFLSRKRMTTEEQSI